MALDRSLVAQAFPPVAFSYAAKDAILYALGIGAKRDELDYLYEGRGPRVIPSFAVVPMFEPMFNVVARTGGDLGMVIHGAQSVRLHTVLSASGTLRAAATLRAVYDMRKFAILLVDTVATNERDEKVFDATSQIIFRGEGGFGGEPPPKEPKEIEVPKGATSDFRIEEATSPEQALLYRLSGDVNPLHADPDFAERVGFAQGPILHGLCTYGFMVRHVAKAACAGDATQVTGFGAQFRRPVWPGDTLVTEGFRVGPGRVALQVSVKERNEIVLSNAWATTK